MEYSRKDEGYPQLLDLIPKNGDWVVTKEDEAAVSEEKALELSLGPPGSVPDSNSTGRDKRERFVSSFGYLQQQQQAKKLSSSSGLLQLHTSGTPAAVSAGSPAEPEKRAFSAANPALHNCNNPNKRTGVVGWPPVRSFRKNNTSNGSCSKLTSDSPADPKTTTLSTITTTTAASTLFVKINMDGVPIGRKIDLKAYDTYDKLSSAVDHLFRNLGPPGHEGKTKIIGGDLLDGCGEYTLVYEDKECDRMLVGDVPWDMFVSTVKRLRVVKSSELLLHAISDGSKLI